MRYIVNPQVHDPPPDGPVTAHIATTTGKTLCGLQAPQGWTVREMKEWPGHVCWLCTRQYEEEREKFLAWSGTP